MQNMWPDIFSENTKISAKTLFEEQAKILPQLTNGIVFAEVKKLDDFDALENIITDDFVFRFDLFGKILKNYRFTVLMFSHDITLYPVKFRLDEKIGEELGVLYSPLTRHSKEIHDPASLETFVTQILRTERIKSVIGSIMRLSK